MVTFYPEMDVIAAQLERFSIDVLRDIGAHFGVTGKTMNNSPVWSIIMGLTVTNATENERETFDKNVNVLREIMNNYID